MPITKLYIVYVITSKQIKTLHASRFKVNESEYQFILKQLIALVVCILLVSSRRCKGSL